MKNHEARATDRDLSHPNGDWNRHYLEIAGARLHYVDEGKGMPIFLLHGWPEFWWTWHRNLTVLSKDFRVITPDLRGFGQSAITPSATPQPTNADVHAQDIIALADSLGIKRFGIVSHDVGAYVSQQLTRKWPERVSGLFFFNAPYPGIGRRWVQARHIQEIWYQTFNQQPWAAELVGYDRNTCRLYFKNMLSHWAYDPDTFTEQLEHWIDNFMRPGNLEGGFAWYAANHASRIALIENGAPVLSKIPVPSQFFWGRHDPVILCDWVDRLPDYFENPIIEIAEDAGHFVHFEQAGAANERIKAFFQSLKQ
jgi:pimeloyl-ACP methyl ester carboxylesterase